MAGDPAPTTSLRQMLPAPEVDRYGERILAATAEQLELVGLARTSVDDVAKRAGVSRITVYRRFGNRQGLLDALNRRELHRLFDLLDRIDHPDPIDNVAEGLATALTFVRDHPLANRLRATDPEVWSRVATADAAPLLALARAYLVSRLLATSTGSAAVDVRALDEVAEVAVRLAHSLALAPGGVFDDQPDAPRRLVERALVPVLRSALADGRRPAADLDPRGRAPTAPARSAGTSSADRTRPKPAAADTGDTADTGATGR